MSFWSELLDDEVMSKVRTTLQACGYESATPTHVTVRLTTTLLDGRSLSILVVVGYTNDGNQQVFDQEVTVQFIVDNNDPADVTFTPNVMCVPPQAP